MTVFFCFSDLKNGSITIESDKNNPRLANFSSVPPFSNFLVDGPSQFTSRNNFTKNHFHPHVYVCINVYETQGTWTDRQNDTSQTPSTQRKRRDNSHLSLQPIAIAIRLRNARHSRRKKSPVSRYGVHAKERRTLTSSAAKSSGQVARVRGMHHRTWHRKHLRVATHRSCEHVTAICACTYVRTDWRTDDILGFARGLDWRLEQNGEQMRARVSIRLIARRSESQHSFSRCDRKLLSSSLTWHAMTAGDVHVLFSDGACSCMYLRMYVPRTNDYRVQYSSNFEDEVREGARDQQWLRR